LSVTFPRPAKISATEILRRRSSKPLEGGIWTVVGQTGSPASELINEPEAPVSLDVAVEETPPGSLDVMVEDIPPVFKFEDNLSKGHPENDPEEKYIQDEDSSDEDADSSADHAPTMSLPQLLSVSATVMPMSMPENTRRRAYTAGTATSLPTARITDDLDDDNIAEMDTALFSTAVDNPIATLLSVSKGATARSLSGFLVLEEAMEARSRTLISTNQGLGRRQPERGRPKT
jgi:hypothetical protein